MSTETKNIWQKMSEIQGKDLNIAKDKAAHGYSYATLDQIMDKLSPLLKEQGLILYHTTGWDPTEKRSILSTYVKNIEKPEEVIESVTHIDGDITLPGQNKYMVAGSAITYFRRYHVTSMFGLCTETDNDAGGARPAGAGKAAAGKSVETAGVEKEVDYIAIFSNMINKKKDKPTLMKQFETYKSKMTPEQATKVETLLKNYA